ncbi:hypothetical protein SEUCBS139899_003666 [Sporothrix eucalyptigena]|uniref:Uncharacterized protein n=1 Tax=Sporothrix eucalyptigena TaxID=1812306 RepID=A0ABP0BQF2_9PEZI
MTRTSVYAGALLAFTAATAMTIAANLVPNWVYYVMYPTAPDSDPYWMSLGLHKSCTSDSPSTTPSSPLFSRPSALSASCRSFPHRDWDCGATPHQQVFCSVWRTIGFLMAIAFVAELVTLLGFVIVLVGGRMKREFGWRVLVPLVEGVAAMQLVAMALVTYLLDHDDRFLVPGWHLGTAWTLCTVSWSVAALTGLGLALAAYVLPPEDGYELLRNPAEVP